jgi:hypothetical protein
LGTIGYLCSLPAVLCRLFNKPRLALALLFTLLLAVSPLAQDTPSEPSALRVTSLEGVVTEVNGSLITIAGGTLIDISRASFIVRGKGPADVRIAPGMFLQIFPADVRSDPLLAGFILTQPEDLLELTAPLDAVDLEGGVLTVLNRRVLITKETLLLPGGINPRKLRPGRFVLVVAKPSGSDFVAARLTLLK